MKIKNAVKLTLTLVILTAVCYISLIGGTSNESKRTL
jgi:hypothetical protein